MGSVEDEPEPNPAVAVTGNDKTDRIARALFRQPWAGLSVSEIARFQFLIVENVQLVSGRLAGSAPGSAKWQTRRMGECYVVRGLGGREKGTGQWILPRFK